MGSSKVVHNRGQCAWGGIKRTCDRHVYYSDGLEDLVTPRSDRTDTTSLKRIGQLACHMIDLPA
eukprot:2229020-Pyramimonas_sp.AAC.1